MNATAWALLALAAAAALANWWSRLRDDRRVEYVSKPAVLVLLLGVALALDPASGAQRAWFCVALVLSLAGDVFLMLPRDRFVPGLASFLLAHLAYVAGFLVDPPDATAVAVGGVAVLLAAATLAAPLVWAIRRREPSLTAPVVAYMGVISAMVTLAVATGDVLAGAGAVAFFVSDYLIARTRFLRPLAWGPVAIMVLYHLGQAGLVLSLTSQP